jgi:hypothetical protein
MFPLLNKKICGQVLEGLRANENIKELKLDWKKIKNDSVFCEGYNFLEANNFFNNELLNLDSNDDGNQPDAARMIVVYMAAMSVSAWSNLEEMLTIIGIAPIWHLDANTNNLLHKYVLADNQSESNYLKRWCDAWRLFHDVFSSLVYFIENKTIIDNIRQTLSDAMAELYPSWQVKDGKINQEFFVVNDYRKITAQEIGDAITTIMDKKDTFGDRAAEMLENVMECALKNGIALDDKCKKTLLEECPANFDIWSRICEYKEEDLRRAWKEFYDVAPTKSGALEHFLRYAFDKLNKNVDDVINSVPPNALGYQFVAYCLAEKKILSQEQFDKVLENATSLNSAEKVELSDCYDIGDVLQYAVDYRLKIGNFEKFESNVATAYDKLNEHTSLNALLTYIGEITYYTYDITKVMLFMFAESVIKGVNIPGVPDKADGQTPFPMPGNLSFDADVCFSAVKLYADSPDKMRAYLHSVLAILPHVSLEVKNDVLQWLSERNVECLGDLVASLSEINSISFQ